MDTSENMMVIEKATVANSYFVLAIGHVTVVRLYVTLAIDKVTGDT